MWGDASSPQGDATELVIALLMERGKVDRDTALQRIRGAADRYGISEADVVESIAKTEGLRP
jgi:hypothetical protein